VPSEGGAAPIQTPGGDFMDTGVIEMTRETSRAHVRPNPAGTLVLMGSGELSPSMVEVHKALVRQCGPKPSAFFIDTPAGFQLNVDDISRRAQQYFETHVGHRLEVASLRSRQDMETVEGHRTLRALQSADYILMGPGSPTYAVRQWIDSPLPDIFRGCLQNGGVICAASAAALTVGWKTLPVYEIYKVGAELHWVDGIDLLGPWGARLVIVPHWNNAEGGTHDTRFCYMGEARFTALQNLLPDDVTVVGIDEHTALILDFAKDRASVRGVGTVTVQTPPEGLGRTPNRQIFSSGETFPLGLLWPRNADSAAAGAMPESPSATEMPSPEEDFAPSHAFHSGGTADFWDEIRSLETILERGLAERNPDDVARSLLDLDRLLWQALQHGAAPEDISQGREVLREWIVSAAQSAALSLQETRRVLSPLVDDVVALRERFRRERQWSQADALREVLAAHHVLVEDTPTGPRWRWATD